jgi:alpha-L-arabinofuranosidase
VNVDHEERPIEIDLKGIEHVGKSAELEVLGGQPDDVNSLENPQRVGPVKSTIKNAGTNFEHTFPASSINIIRLKTR